MSVQNKGRTALTETVSVVALAHRPGLIGQILRTLRGWMLAAADRWAEQTLAYEQKRDIPNRLSLPNPWSFLRSSPAVPSNVKAVCRAAESQLWAWRRISRMRMGFATLHEDLHERAMRAKAQGNEREYARAIGQFANRVVIYAPAQHVVRTSTEDPEILRQMENNLKKRRAQLVHRGQGTDARQPRPWPPWVEFASSNKLPVALVAWWVSFPEGLVLRPPSGGKPGLLLQPGTPGLMFFRNEALTKFLKFATDNANLTPATVKKARQRLKLVPVGDHTHLVWDVSIIRRADGHWDMKLITRTSENRPSNIRRPTRVFRQVVSALARAGFTKVGVGKWMKTTGQAKWRLETRSDPVDNDFFWIVVCKR